MKPANRSLLSVLTTMLLSVCIAPSARADRAENAFVTVRAVGADVTRVDGRNFSAQGDTEVEIEAQPGWTLLTPSRVRVTKGQSPRYRVKSVSNEDDGHGDIYWTTTEQILRHMEDPTVTADVSAGGPYVYAAPQDGTNVVLSCSASATPGMHVWETRTTVYKNGAVVSTSASNSAPFPLELDQWSWEWSLGPENGTTNVQSFSTAPVFLSHGTYTARGRVTGSSSQCESCTKADTATTNFPVSLLTVTCDPWIGQDRTGDPSAPYTSPKVTATAKLEPENPDVKKVTWGGENKCEMSDPKDWTISLWTEDREKASDTYLGETITASIAGATATTNFTIVKVDIELDGEQETEEESPGAIVPLFEQLSDKSTGNLNQYIITCWPELPGGEEILVAASNPNDLFLSMNSRAKFSAKTTMSAMVQSGYVIGAEPSTTLQDKNISAIHRKSNAIDSASYTSPYLSFVENVPDPQLESVTRQRIGVAEDLTITINLGTAKNWAEGAAIRKAVSPHNLSLEAPHVAGAFLVKAELTSGKELEIGFTVVEPGIVSHALYNSIFPYPSGMGGAALFTKHWVAPSDVSFSKVETREVGLKSEDPKGYFADPNRWEERKLDHSLMGAPEDGWGRIEAVGKKNFVCLDEANSGACPPEWIDGSFSWKIPALWRVAGDASEHPLKPWSDQQTTITKQGTVSVRKFGFMATRNAYAPDYIYQYYGPYNPEPEE